MTLEQIPLFAMLKGRMGYETERQRVVSQNIANADTPGYTPNDLKPFSFSHALSDAMAGVEPSRTSPMHLAGKARRPTGQPPSQAAPDSEARLDGNQVVLEEEMMKMSDARGAYDTAVTLYQNSLNMLRTAVRKPGG